MMPSDATDALQRLPSPWRWWLTGCLLALILLLLAPPTGRWIKEPIKAGVHSLSRPYVDSGLQRAGVSYAAARGLNGIISLVQESELQATLFGTGASVAAGQLLDPLNDLVERFSWVMLLSLASFGIQKILIEIVPWIGLDILVSLSLAALFLGVVLLREAWVRIGLSGLLCSLILVLFIPAAALMSQKVYDHFLADTYRTSVETITGAQEELNPNAQAASGSLWRQLKELNLAAKIRTLKAMTQKIIDHIVGLIVVFVLQTVVLPLALLWGLVRALKGGGAAAGLLTGMFRPQAAAF